MNPRAGAWDRADHAALAIRTSSTGVKHPPEGRERQRLVQVSSLFSPAHRPAKDSLRAALRTVFSFDGVAEGMSFPVAVPDRRILPRQKCAEPCVVHLSAGEMAAARLIQSDLHGVRLRLLEPREATQDTVLVRLEDGRELLAKTRWRIGDVLGLERLPFSAERVRPFRQDAAA
ncbi:MAG TPA: hypothetical protein PLQ03_01400 [Brevundimonas sp.]|uniref:hypothetical protein n=1 Tax=Brevundimonas sp. TaxID=1871086 RepID=UPI00261903A3|nr:hypothetical protein [Brevundimonas sp.]HRO32047.1 hypothetical protein [Brevundimonas sp.]